LSSQTQKGKMSSSAMGSDKKNPQVVQPLEADVLLGRGKRAISRSGNVRFRNIIKAWTVEYGNSIDPHIRDSIANRVMATVREEGGRFLQQQQRADHDITQPSTWVVIPEASVRTKVKQALRDASKMPRCTRKHRATSMAGAAASATQRQRSHSVDLEPRPIEEILRTSSGTELYSLSSFRAMLQESPTRSAPVARLKVEMERRLRQYGNLKRDDDPSETSVYYPTPARSSQMMLAHDFRSMLRRQQDIQSCQLPIHDVAARLMFQDGRRPATAPSIERIEMNVISAQNWQRPELPDVGDSSFHSSSTSDFMIGQAAITQPADQHLSTVFLDETIRDLLLVDQRNRLRPDDHSTFGSYFEEQEQHCSSLSGHDDPSIEGSGVPP
jgi:hypothetical protein